MYHVYIPSKGRAQNCKTAQVLLADNVACTILVEPQDYKAYCKEYGKSSVYRLEKDNQGLWYARNCAMSLSIERDEYAHWQMDDDISRFYVRNLKEKKNTRVTPSHSIKQIERLKKWVV